MAEETDAGEADCTRKVASECRHWSAGVAVLLSAYPFVFCCVHKVVFPCLEMLIQGTSPPRAVSSKALPRCLTPPGVLSGILTTQDKKMRLHVRHADVLVLQPWVASGSLP